MDAERRNLLEEARQRNRRGSKWKWVMSAAFSSSMFALVLSAMTGSGVLRWLSPSLAAIGGLAAVLFAISPTKEERERRIAYQQGSIAAALITACAIVYAVWPAARPVEPLVILGAVSVCSFAGALIGWLINR